MQIVLLICYYSGSIELQTVKLIKKEKTWRTLHNAYRHFLSNYRVKAACYHTGAGSFSYNHSIHSYACKLMLLNFRPISNYQNCRLLCCWYTLDQNVQYPLSHSFLTKMRDLWSRGYLYRTDLMPLSLL